MLDSFQSANNEEIITNREKIASNTIALNTKPSIPSNIDMRRAATIPPDTVMDLYCIINFVYFMNEASLLKFFSSIIRKACRFVGHGARRGRKAPCTSLRRHFQSARLY